MSDFTSFRVMRDYHDISRTRMSMMIRQAYRQR